MALIPLDGKETPEEAGGEVITKKKELGFDLNTVAIILVSMILLFSLLFFPQTVEGYKTPINQWMLILLCILALIALMVPRVIVKFLEYERGVVFRIGKFDRIAGPGWAIIFPFMETYARVDLRLHVYTIDPQEVVTKDKVRFLISPEVFMYISNPTDAVLNVENAKAATLGYITSSLRHVGGNSTSDYIISHMDEVSHMLEESIHHISTHPGRGWGVSVPRVKLTLVRFPDRVQDAMHEKVASEQLKLAAHEKAAATKIEIDAIREAGGKLTDPAITYMYLEALDKIARGRATKIILPLEVSKLAETITKRTGQTTAPPGLPLETINEYKGIIDSYEKRLSSIEHGLVREGKTEEKRESEEQKDVGAEEERDEEYDRKIRRIKKRLGMDS